MKKPALLREAIVAMIPDLALNPDRLDMWVEKGTLRATNNRQHGFAWEYDLSIYAEDYTGEPAVLFFAITEWLRDYQPSLLAANGSGFPFEVIAMTADAVDVSITVPLVEVVTVNKVDGEWQLTVVDEAVPLLTDDVPLRATEGPLASISVVDDDAPFQVAP